MIKLELGWIPEEVFLLLLLYLGEDKEESESNSSFCNSFCLRLCGFCKANGDSQWANIVFCRWWKGVEDDSMKGEICTGANLVGKKYSNAGDSGGVGVLKFVLILCTGWFWVGKLVCYWSSYIYVSIN